MLANGNVDLAGNFEIWTWLTVGNMNFDNYYAEVCEGIPNLVQLVKLVQP
jgi:hypothetical protein